MKWSRKNESKNRFRWWNLKGRLIKFLLISLKCLQYTMIVRNPWRLLFNNRSRFQQQRPNFILKTQFKMQNNAAISLLFINLNSFITRCSSSNQTPSRSILAKKDIPNVSLFQIRTIRLVCWFFVPFVAVYMLVNVCNFIPSCQIMFSFPMNEEETHSLKWSIHFFARKTYGC